MGNPVLSSSVWLTTADVEKRTQLERHLIYRAIRRKQLRAAQLDGAGGYRFKAEWVDAWLEARAEPIEK